MYLSFQLGAFKTLKTKRFLWIGMVGIVLILSGCQQEIEVELPSVDPTYVIEGSIFEGEAPLVFVGKAQGYFDPVSASSLGQSFLSGAEVTMHWDEFSVQLDALCTGDLPENLQDIAAELLGFPLELLQQMDLCVYTSFDPAVRGISGKRYDLEVEIENHFMHASTTIEDAVSVDSAWFQTPGTQDSLGLIHAIFTDPVAEANAYRWFARRINLRPGWDPMAGQIKDPDFVAPLGSVFDDSFFNGLTFEFSTFRGIAPGSTAWDDDFSSSPEAGYFKEGDTVVVRMCAIDEASYAAISSYENLILSQGSPFALPANMMSNVEGGIGLWAGYGIWQDTVICVE